MKIIVAVVSLLVLTGCGDVGRYQMVSSPHNQGLYRLDTKTGEIDICLVGADSSMKCVKSLQQFSEK